MIRLIWMRDCLWRRLPGGTRAGNGRMLAGLALAITSALSLAACTEEDPTEIGAPLLPDGEIVTFEVILEPTQYLAFDTAFSGYVDAFGTPIMQVMQDYQGVTDANALLRHGQLPTVLSVRDTAGVTRTDTLPRFPDGYIKLSIDTVASVGSGSLVAFQTAQEWDASGATWALRVDTGGVQLPWTQPGGTRGPRIGAAAWSPSAGTDSVTIPLDSVTIKALTDTANHARGILITLEQPGSGGATIRIDSVLLRINSKSSIRPDTTIVTTIAPTTFTFLFTPDPPSVAGSLRVSGIPSWRGMFGIIDNIGALTVPCPGPGCTVRLRDAFVNRAELQLQPTGSPAGFAPEDSIRIQPHALLRTPDVPLSRTPIGAPVLDDPRPPQAIPQERFTNTDNGPPVGISITNLFADMVTDTATNPANQVPRSLALIAVTETRALIEAATFGFATFRAAPRLRLVLTISAERRP